MCTATGIQIHQGSAFDYSVTRCINRHRFMCRCKRAQYTLYIPLQQGSACNNVCCSTLKLWTTKNCTCEDDADRSSYKFSYSWDSNLFINWFKIHSPTNHSQLNPKVGFVTIWQDRVTVAIFGSVDFWMRNSGFRFQFWSTTVHFHQRHDMRIRLKVKFRCSQQTPQLVHLSSTNW